MTYDWLVVGAGLTGATFAERMAAAGARVLVVESRAHIGGNTYDEVDETGTLVHRYGAHIFHTGSDAVWTYLSRFTEWRPYRHRVLTEIDGRLLPMPVNLTTLEALLPGGESAPVIAALLQRYGAESRVPVLKLLEDEQPLVREAGRLVLEKAFLPYTRKQWGLDPQQLDPSVTARVPVVLSRADGYFRDRYQAIPATGYTAMVRRMLASDRIDVVLETDGLHALATVPHRRVLWTGEIDTYFGGCAGRLPYRSLRFETRLVETPDLGFAQPVAVVNTPSPEVASTRVIEHRHFLDQRLTSSTTTTEFPQPHVHGVTTPFYPLPEASAQRQFDVYADLAQAEFPRVLFAGRLADYRYYDMHQAVGRALSLARGGTHLAPSQRGPGRAARVEARPADST